MRKASLCLVIVAFLTLSVGAFGFQNKPDGFRGLKWRDPPTEDMEFVFEVNIRKEYIRPGDKMSLGEVELGTILYGFVEVDGELKFCIASLRFVNESRFTILKTICEERFGPPTSEESYRLSWFDGGEVAILLSYDFTEKSGLLELCQMDLLMIWFNWKEKAEGAESDW